MLRARLTERSIPTEISRLSRTCARRCSMRGTVLDECLARGKKPRRKSCESSRGSLCLYTRLGQTTRAESAYSHLCKDPSKPPGTTIVSSRDSLSFSLFIALHRLTETLYTRSPGTTIAMASIALPALRTARRPARQVLDAFVLRTSVAASSSSSSSRSSLAAPLYTAFAAAFAAPAFSNNTAVPSALASLIPDTLAGLRDLLPPWLLAAPKRRTTHGAKRMRSSNKGLKEKQSESPSPPLSSIGKLNWTVVVLQTLSRARLADRPNSHTTSATSATPHSGERSTARHEGTGSRPRRRQHRSRMLGGMKEGVGLLVFRTTSFQDSRSSAPSNQTRTGRRKPSAGSVR